MIHYSCDLCGKKIRDERYTVKVEIAPAVDPDELTAADLDVDHLQMIAEEISAMESTADFALPETGPQQLQFDLCARCCHTYARSPLGRLAPTRPDFSHN